MFKKLNSTVALVALISSASFAIAQQTDSIEIYSPNSDPNKPIKIEQSGNPLGTEMSSSDAVNPPESSLPKSDLDSIPPMSEEEAKAMLEILKQVNEEKNAEQIEQDPLAGLNPEQRAFMEAMQSVIPMTPDQIELFKKRYYDSQVAKNRNVNGDISPISRSIDLSLVPGEDLPVVRMSPGNVTTITFSDRNGNPWPVLSVTSGDGSSFSAETAGQEGDTNILVVNPLKNWASSNMVVTLVGHPVPILMTLDSRENSVVDYRLDVRIDKRGPNSDDTIIEDYQLPSTNDSTMLSFLDGVPPESAEKMETSHSSVSAWVYNDEMYIRTNGKILSPAYTSKSSNVSGVSIFVLQQSPVIILSKDGVMQNVTIQN
jgi:intracellular multiplication protein IcmK